MNSQPYPDELLFSTAVQAAKVLPCGHLFHSHCLGAWLTTAGQANFTCPVCRTSLFAAPPHRPPPTYRNSVAFPYDATAAVSHSSACQPVSCLSSQAPEAAPSSGTAAVVSAADAAVDAEASPPAQLPPSRLFAEAPGCEKSWEQQVAAADHKEEHQPASLSISHVSKRSATDTSQAGSSYCCCSTADVAAEEFLNVHESWRNTADSPEQEYASAHAYASDPGMRMDATAAASAAAVAAAWQALPTALRAPGRLQCSRAIVQAALRERLDAGCTRVAQQVAQSATPLPCSAVSLSVSMPDNCRLILIENLVQCQCAGHKLRCTDSVGCTGSACCS